MEDGHSMHITIQRGTTLPTLKRCSTCCNDYHCPFCCTTLFRPQKFSKVRCHLDSHFNRAVVHQGYTIHRCGLKCRPKWHYHCVYCGSMLSRKPDFLKHLFLCKTKKDLALTTTTPAPPTTTPAPPTTTPAPPTTTPAPPTTTPAPPTTTPAPPNTTPAPTTTTPAPPNTTPAPTTTTPAPPNTTPAPTTTTPAPPNTTPAPTTTTPAPPNTTPAPTTTTPTPPNTTPAPTTTIPAPTTAQTELRQRVLVKPVVQKECPICKVLMNTRNLKRHIERKHTNKHQDIMITSHLQSECIDPENGVYAVHKSFLGTSVPLHVQNKIWGENLRVCCESAECQENMELAWQNGFKAYQCIHLKSIPYCTSYASSSVLLEETLSEMVSSQWFGEDEKKMCLNLQSLAEQNRLPLSVLSKMGTPETKKYLSIFEPTVSDYSRLGRVMVSFDTEKESWDCPCVSTQTSCLHECVAKWHLFQTHHKLLVRSTEEEEWPSPSPTTDKDSHDEADADVDDSHYPPKHEKVIKGMVQYLLKSKKLPAVLPEQFWLPSMETQYPKHLIPEEMMCQLCPQHVPLSDPVLITNKAKILTSIRIVEDVSTYCKSCHQCGTFYRYQEWKDGLHNFNDRILLDLPLCMTIRNMLQVHTAVSRVVEYLELTTEVQYPPADTVLHGYLHFEALTDHEYEYSCVTCGDHPPVVIMGVHRGAFQWSVSDLPQPPGDFSGEVDVGLFWETLSMERIGRGFVSGHRSNLFAVSPTFHFWAPWIGRNTRRADSVLNTEFQKVRPPKQAEVCEFSVTEEQLRDKLWKQKVEVLRNLCRECGLDSSGSHTDLLLRLSSEMKSRQTYDKVFQKIWAASGGWAVITCPCGVVYSIKCNIRAESPRDFADLLLSWTHMPNIVIYDFARGLATHTNLREPDRLPFSPFEGRLRAPSTDTISRAKSGNLKVSLPWLNSKKPVADCDGHPVTGSAQRYALYDQFHEDDKKDPRDALRRLDLVPQLAGNVSSQTVEQLFAKMKKNNYFFNRVSPSTHLFLMRNLIHHYNTHRNKQRVDTVKKAFKPEVGMDIFNQAVLEIF
ncbi:uncharacterized protein LOC110969121 [Acanthochromis polyacanthus]|uniref:uncharacterized protein LOC110969121 n=1 Tax=Acanthochromis polyacanthus TaxID=80966 RepID=UPI00223404C8|nr:uncharacterized protein LOC110969121 [Acanthochromis polyacanthus]